MTLRAVAKNARHHDRCVADNPSTAPGATEDGWTCLTSTRYAQPGAYEQ